MVDQTTATTNPQNLLLACRVWREQCCCSCIPEIHSFQPMSEFLGQKSTSQSTRLANESFISYLLIIGPAKTAEMPTLGAPLRAILVSAIKSAKHVTRHCTAEKEKEQRNKPGILFPHANTVKPKIVVLIFNAIPNV